MSVLNLTVEQSGLPVGSYRAKFVGVEESSHDEWGPGLTWKFEVTEGPQKGNTGTRTTGPKVTTKNACGKMIASLSGGSLEVGEKVDPSEFIGQAYSIAVAETKSGGTRVESVITLF